MTLNLSHHHNICVTMIVLSIIAINWTVWRLLFPKVPR